MSFLDSLANAASSQGDAKATTEKTENKSEGAPPAPAEDKRLPSRSTRGKRLEIFIFVKYVIVADLCHLLV